ncbi:MAG: zinc ribbon domain-containing protein [Coprococcus sp.]|nr:zinc ribbon domain-containing protein [Coprococcus sp.]
MKCQFCNREIKDGAKFCSFCGKPQEAPQAPHLQTDKEKHTSKKPMMIAMVIVLLFCAVGAGVFVLSRPGGNHTEKKDGMFDIGGGQAKENSLTQYLEYIGTEFEELPDSFEREVLNEFDEFDYVWATKAEEYAGLEGKVCFYGYDIKDDAAKDEWDLTTEISGVSWMPEKQDEESVERLIKQINKDYGEYDNKEIHTIKDRQTDSSMEIEMMEYTCYFWAAQGEWDYDIELEIVDELDIGVEDSGMWRMHITPCIGEPDTEYLKPLHKMEQAYEERDTELMEEVFSDIFYENTNITREEVMEMMEELQDSASEHKISFDVKNAEILSSTWGFTVLNREYGITGDGLEDVREKYLIDAELVMNKDGEEEKGEVTLVVGKEKGEWKIIFWEIL